MSEAMLGLISSFPNFMGLLLLAAALVWVVGFLRDSVADQLDRVQGDLEVLTALFAQAQGMTLKQARELHDRRSGSEGQGRSP